MNQRNRATLFRNNQNGSIAFFAQTECRSMAGSEFSRKILLRRQRKNTTDPADPALLHNNSSVVNRTFLYKNTFENRAAEMSVETRSRFDKFLHIIAALQTDQATDPSICKPENRFGNFFRIIPRRSHALPQKKSKRIRMQQNRTDFTAKNDDPSNRSHRSHRLKKARHQNQSRRFRSNRKQPQKEKAHRHLQRCRSAKQKIKAMQKEADQQNIEELLPGKRKKWCHHASLKAPIQSSESEAAQPSFFKNQPYPKNLKKVSTNR